MARFALLGNPTSGSGRGAAATSRALAELQRRGHDACLLTAGDADEGMRLARETLPEMDGLVVVGGDGMAHLGINAVVGTDTPLGLVAAGSGNDFAVAAGLPVHRPEAAVAMIADALARPRRVDLGRIDHGDATTYFGAVLAAGFDAVVNERANRWTRPRGSAKYALAVLRELPVFTPVSYTLLVDGVLEQVDGVLVAVGNAASYGGGLRITHGAAIDDGALDLLVAGDVSRTELVRILPSIRRGGHLRHPAVTIRRVRSVRIEAANIVGYADGERVGPLPLQVSVAPGAMTLLG